MPYKDIELVREANRKSYRKYSVKRNIEIAAWIAAHPEARARHSRDNGWKRQGIKNADGTQFRTANYEEWFRKQNGMCAITGCIGQPSDFKKIFDVDHNHKTGVVRGLLCANHNKVLGKVKDSVGELRSLIDYLKIGEEQCH